MNFRSLNHNNAVHAHEFWLLLEGSINNSVNGVLDHLIMDSALQN